MSIMTNIKCRNALGLVASLVAAACSQEMLVTGVDAGEPKEMGGSPSRGRVGTDASVGVDVGSPDSSTDVFGRSDTSADLMGTVPDLRPDLLSNLGTDLLSDLSPDLVVLPDLQADTLISTPDIQSSKVEAGKEAAATCPSSCFEGCYNGCGSDGQCKSCATCTCEVVTGLCHC